MALVFIQPAPLFPIRNGQQSTGYRLVQQLAKRVDLHVVLLYQSGNSESESARITAEELSRQGIRFSSYEIAPGAMLKLLPMFLPAFLRDHLFESFLNLPDELISIYRDPNNTCLYFGSSYDLFAHWHSRQPAGRYLFPADSIGYFQNNNRESRPLRRILKPFKCFFANCVERDLYRGTVIRTFYVSEHDQQYLKDKRIDTGSISRTVRIGVALPENTREYQLAPACIRLAFSGVMAYRPNEQAAFFLTDEILPHLPKGDFSLSLIGKDPSPELISRGNEQISILGEVDDIHLNLLECDAFVSPLFTGAGAKNKILSALGCGLPVLGTKQSFSGFGEIPPGSVIFSDKEELLSELRKLRRWSLDQWRQHGQAGSAYIRQNFTWEASADALLNWMQEVEGSLPRKP